MTSPAHRVYAFQATLNPGGCPTAKTCDWARHPESPEFQLCGRCGVDRPKPVVP